MGKTLSSHIIHSLGGEYCWIVRDSEPIRLLKSPRSLSVYILRTDTFRAEDKVHAILLPPVISRQQTVFLSDLRFFFQWCDGSINLKLRRCAVSGMFKRELRCRAYFSLRRNRPPRPRMFAVSLNSLNGKNSSRSIVQNIFFSVYLFYSRFQD